MIKKALIVINLKVKYLLLIVKKINQKEKNLIVKIMKVLTWRIIQLR